MIWWLLACTGTPAGDDTAAEASPCEAGDNPTLTIGTGEYSYEEMAPGTELELIHGPQGGYHVILAVEATYLDASSRWTAKLVGTLDGVEAAHTWPYVDARCNESRGTLQGWNLFLIFDEGWAPEDIHDRDAEVDVTVTDAAGTPVSASTSIHIWDPTLE